MKPKYKNLYFWEGCRRMRNMSIENRKRLLKQSEKSDFSITMGKTEP